MPALWKRIGFRLKKITKFIYSPEFDLLWSLFHLFFGTVEVILEQHIPNLI